MEKYAVIVAGGSGTRMGTQTPKQFLLLKGRPVLWYTLIAFLDAFEDMKIILVLPEQYLETGKSLIHSTSAPHRIKVVTGGNTRFNSVKNGLAAIQSPSVVFVHDGVRCLISVELIQRCYSQTLEMGNAVPAIAVVDSIRMETEEGNKVIDRTKLRVIQTPQTFLSDVLQNAFKTDFRESFTDEASVVEHAGGKIHLVEGERTNIKITQPFDILLAEEILKTRAI